LNIDLIRVAYREIMTPEADNRAFEDFVRIPFINRPTLCTVLNIEASGTLHVKTDHMIVGVTP
jgi:hypothetical protein